MKAVFLLLALVGVTTVTVSAKEVKAPISARGKVLVLDPFKVHGSPIIS